MSDLMFDKTPVVGKKYNFGDWKLYAVHNDKEIKGFFGEYRWLSNFPNCDIYFEGIKYNSPETAYQAQKIIPEQREAFSSLPAYEAKKEWKKDKYFKLYKSDHWDKIKYDIMLAITFDKYYRNYNLRTLLLETGKKYLEETNHWKDKFWGVDINLGGENKLGIILMKIREFWIGK